MSKAEFVPKGMSEMNLDLFIEAIGRGKYDGRGWSGVFDSVNMAILFVFARGDIPRSVFMDVYGEGGALDMLSLWRNDLKGEVSNGALYPKEILDKDRLSDLFDECRRFTKDV